MNMHLPQRFARSTDVPRSRRSWIGLLVVLLIGELAAAFLLSSGLWLRTGAGLAFWTALVLIWMPIALAFLYCRQVVSKRRFQFSLRGLLAWIVLLGVILGGLGIPVARSRQQRATAAILELRGARTTWAGADEPGLKQLLGVEYFSGVAEISFNNPRAVGDAQLAQLHVFKDTLESLQVQGGQVTDVGLESLDKLKNLKFLSFAGTPLGDAGLAHLGKLPSLEHLVLHSTRVDGRGLAHLAALERLEDLTLIASPITDQGLSRIGGLRNLRTLRLDRTAITDAGLAHLGALTKLRRLSLDRTAVTDLKPLTALQELQSLSLKGTAATDAGLAHMDRCHNLRTLSLDGSAVTDAGLVYVGRLKNLEQLDLSFTAVTDAGLAHLNSLARLRLLIVDGAGITTAGAHEFRRAMPGLVVAD